MPPGDWRPNRGVRLREGRISDAPSLMAVHRQSILELGRAAYSDAEVDSWVSGLVPEIYIEAITSGGETYLVAEVQDDIIGFCAFRESEITGLYVRSEVSRTGLGTRLLKTAEGRLAPCRSITLRAALSAVAFYRAQGYRILREGHWRTRGGLDIAVCDMEKDRG